MIQFSMARIGTSEAAKRIDRAALAFQRRREAEAESRRPAPATPTPPPVASPVRSARQWAEDQVADWAERQPHIAVTTFKPTWRRIVEEAAEAHGVTVADLLGSRRFTPLVLCRQEAMYRIAEVTPLSLLEIGRRLGKDHTTVLHGIRSHAARNGLPLPRQDDADAPAEPDLCPHCAEPLPPLAIGETSPCGHIYRSDAPHPGLEPVVTPGGDAS